MKRINPKTNKSFKRGDMREDGYVFRQYDLTYLLPTGYFAESWTRPANLEANREQTNSLTKARYHRLVNS